MSRSRPGCAHRLALLEAVVALVLLDFVPSPSRVPALPGAQPVGLVSGGTAPDGTASVFPPVQTQQPVLHWRRSRGMHFELGAVLHALRAEPVSSAQVRLQP
ncbi:MAG: hypothetical protein ACRDYA_18595 [Egibacteraceae bacterium]